MCRTKKLLADARTGRRPKRATREACWPNSPRWRNRQARARLPVYFYAVLNWKKPESSGFFFSCGVKNRRNLAPLLFECFANALFTRFFQLFMRLALIKPEHFFDIFEPYKSDAEQTGNPPPRQACERTDFEI